MNCQNCDAIMTSRICACGWSMPTEELPTVSPKPPQVIGDKLTEVKAFVSQYRKTNPTATNRDGCIQFLRDRRQMQLLSLVDQEAKAEREAIQAGNWNDDYFER